MTLVNIETALFKNKEVKGTFTLVKKYWNDKASPRGGRIAILLNDKKANVSVNKNDFKYVTETEATPKAPEAPKFIETAPKAPVEEITLTSLRAIAERLMSGDNKLGYDVTERGYRFEFSNRSSALGDVHYGTKIIRLSKKFIKSRTLAEMEMTILHEIAHAIAYEDHNHTGHGQVWKNIFISLGGTGKRCGSVSNSKLTVSKYVVVIKQGDKIEVFKRLERLTRNWKGSNIKGLYVTGRKKETMGRLEVITFAEYKRYLDNDLIIKK